MDIKQAVADYVTAHAIENFSPETLANTRRNLRYFVDWLVSAHSISDTDDLQLAHLRRWISYLQKTPARHGGKRSDSSVHTYGMSMLALKCSYRPSNSPIDVLVSLCCDTAQRERPCLGA